MVEAMAFGHDAVWVQCEGLEELAKVAGREKVYDTIVSPTEGLQSALDERARA